MTIEEMIIPIRDFMEDIWNIASDVFNIYPWVKMVLFDGIESLNDNGELEV